MTTTLPHQLDRTITIRAPRETVFRFFTDNARWASWWGAGSTVDPRPAGKILIRYPDGTEAVGEVVDLRAPERIAFSFGFVSGKPIPRGGSRVTIDLERDGDGSRLHLLHEFADASVREEFVQGWRYQLSVFANIVADEIHKDAAALADAWFAAWGESDAATREREIRRMTSPAVTLRDRFSCTDGADDLLPHLAAAHRFMPGIRLKRDGNVRHCQGVALADWIAVAADGQERARGTNVFRFGADGRIESVTGFWGR